MRPILLSVGPFEVPSFFLMVTIGALVATFLSAHMAKKEGLNEVVMLDFGIIGMTVGIIGAKLFHVVFEDPTYYMADPKKIFYLWEGGFVSVGAFISTIAGWIVYLKAKKLDPWPYLDLAALVAPIIVFFTRIGCFLAGCCFGRPTHMWFGLVFPKGSLAGNSYPGIPIYPTQNIFQINALILALVVWVVYKKRKSYGQVIAAFLACYGFTRFFIEFLRSPIGRGHYFGLPAAQIVMVGFFATGIIIWFVRKRHRIGHI